MDRKKRSAGALTGALVLAGSALVASAAEGDIEYRQSVYSSIGGHMSAMSAILKQEVPHTVDLAVHANGIANLAPLTMHLFPEGSGDGRTKAKAAIWENPEDFAEKRQNFIDAAAALGDVAGADMETFVGAFRELGGTCKACHDDYKAD
jgi:cytochrome c556